MHERDRFEALLALIDELIDDNDRIPILVEGQRDVASLRRLGCRGEIHCLHAGVSLMALAERLSQVTRTVILLTDWDRKGGILFEQLATTLGVNSVRLHGQYWDRLAASTAPSLQDVESLAGYVGRHLGRHMRLDLDERLASLDLEERLASTEG